MFIVKLEGRDAELFTRVLQELIDQAGILPNRHYRFAIDGEGVKVKMGEGMWTPGYGTVEPRG